LFNLFFIYSHKIISSELFSEDTIVNLYEFESAVSDYENGKEEKLRKILVPAELALLEVIPHIQVEKNIDQLLVGKPLMKSDYSKKLPEETFAVFHKERFISVMRPVDEEDIIARAEFVLN